MKHNLTLLAFLGLLNLNQAAMSQAEAQSMADIDLAFMESFSTGA